MQGRLGGSVVEHLPLAQGMIPGSWDQVPHRASCMEPASPSAYVSASLCVSLMNKYIKSLKIYIYVANIIIITPLQRKSCLGGIEGSR